MTTNNSADATIKCEAITSLFIGLMIANILIALEKFKVDKIEKVTFDIIFLTITYIVYILYGYFNLFKYFHKEYYPKEVLPKINDSKNISERLLLFVTGLNLSLISIAPYFIKPSYEIGFYIVFLLIGITDYFWTKHFMIGIDLHEQTTGEENIKLFDLAIIVISSLAVIVIYYTPKTYVYYPSVFINLLFLLNPITQLISNFNVKQ